MCLLYPDKVHKAKNIVTNRFQPPTNPPVGFALQDGINLFL